MKNQNEKKGFFSRLVGSKKDQKSSCCGNFRIEEIPKEQAENNKKSNDSSKVNNNCCSK
jgi:hypothetical protein